MDKVVALAIRIDAAYKIECILIRIMVMESDDALTNFILWQVNQTTNLLLLLISCTF